MLKLDYMGVSAVNWNKAHTHLPTAAIETPCSMFRNRTPAPLPKWKETLLSKKCCVKKKHSAAEDKKKRY